MNKSEIRPLVGNLQIWYHTEHENTIHILFVSIALLWGIAGCKTRSLTDVENDVQVPGKTEAVIKAVVVLAMAEGGCEFLERYDSSTLWRYRHGIHVVNILAS